MKVLICVVGIAGLHVLDDAGQESALCISEVVGLPDGGNHALSAALCGVLQDLQSIEGIDNAVTIGVSVSNKACSGIIVVCAHFSGKLQNSHSVGSVDHVIAVDVAEQEVRLQAEFAGSDLIALYIVGIAVLIVCKLLVRQECIQHDHARIGICCCERSGLHQCRQRTHCCCCHKNWQHFFETH